MSRLAKLRFKNLSKAEKDKIRRRFKKALGGKTRGTKKKRKGKGVGTTSSKHRPAKKPKKRPSGGTGHRRGTRSPKFTGSGPLPTRRSRDTTTSQVPGAPGAVTFTPLDNESFFYLGNSPSFRNKDLWSNDPGRLVYPPNRLRRHLEIAEKLIADWQRPASQEFVDEEGNPRFRELLDGLTTMEMRRPNSIRPFKPTYAEDIQRGV